MGAAGLPELPRWPHRGAGDPPGIKPFRTATHGPFTSFYYHDPDGNSVELFGSNFDTEEEYLGYFKTESFSENHTGIDVDPEEFVRRFRSGAPQSNLLKIPI